MINEIIFLSFSQQLFQFSLPKLDLKSEDDYSRYTMKILLAKIDIKKCTVSNIKTKKKTRERDIKRIK
jgi:hypothetical protein